MLRPVVLALAFAPLLPLTATAQTADPAPRRPSLQVLESIIELCVAAGAIGHRGEVVLSYVARAGAALRGAEQVELRDVVDHALLALRHRVHREAFDSAETIDRRLLDLVRSVISPAPVPA